MGDSKSISKSLNSIYKSTFQKKYLAMTLFVVVLFILFSGGFGLFNLVKNKLSGLQGDICGDGSSYSTCSSVKPYFCSYGELIDLAYICGCPEGFTLISDSCSSPYEGGSRVISLKYTLNGESDSIDFLAYDGFADYVSKIPRSINYSEGDNISKLNFKLKAINEEEQRKFLLPLVIKIQNITKDKEDQARIAISLVQNIPFGSSNKTFDFFGEQINYTRYPYEVLYDVEGVCGEKTDLLSFLLRELGYGVSLFYYPKENHEALGIKCPLEESLMKTGYCFIETTGPSIIGDNGISYIGTGKLSSTPEFYILSDGESIGENLQEYEDVETLNRIRGDIEKSGLIGPIDRKTFRDLREKYGLPDEYSR